MLDHRINTFICVCDNMSYTRAARELNMTRRISAYQIPGGTVRSTSAAL